MGMVFTRSSGRRKLKRALAHEVRNSLASISGCGHTLLYADEAIAPDLRRQLISVMIRQSEYLDWLVRALSSSDGKHVDAREPIEAERVLRVAAEFADVAVSGSCGDLRVVADETAVRLGFEALLIGVRPSGDPHLAHVTPAPDAFVITSAARELDEAQRWKLGLAKDLLRRQGMIVNVRSRSKGLDASVRVSQRQAWGGIQ